MKDDRATAGSMTPDELRGRYLGYIDCLNRRDWSRLGDFVADGVRHNDRALGLSGYRAMLERDVAAIPDLRFDVGFLVSEPPTIGARLLFDCRPKGTLFGLAVEGRRVTFTENVFYRFAAGRIDTVWSVIDQAAVRAQL